MNSKFITSCYAFKGSILTWSRDAKNLFSSNSLAFLVEGYAFSVEV